MKSSYDVLAAIDVDGVAGEPGLGLWNHRYVTIAAELAVLSAGGLIYLRWTRPRSRLTTVATIVFGTFLVALSIGTSFQPDPPSGRAFAVRALWFYAILALVAGLIDRNRIPRLRTPGAGSSPS